MAQSEGRRAIYQALGSRCYNLEAMAVTRSQYHFESVDDETAAIMRAKTPAERLQIAGGMWRFAREMVLCVLKREHPTWDEERIRREAARRLSHGAV